jgi:hypothetical protein
MEGQDPAHAAVAPEGPQEPEMQEQTINMTTPSGGTPAAPGAATATSGGVTAAAGAGGGSPPGGLALVPRVLLKPYQQEKRQDYVRMVVTVGLLSMLAVVVVWSCVEMMSYREHWENAKEMLQILLSPLTGLLGSVIGFYFGSGANKSATAGGSLDGK